MANFTPDTFTDGATGGTPITAAKLNNIENELAVVAPSAITAGVLASRPAAGNAKALYLATDVGPSPGTLYEDNGTSWQPLSGTSELGYAETNAPFSTTSTTFVGITGLLISFTAGDRPFYVDAICNHYNSTAGQSSICALQISTNGGSSWTNLDYTYSGAAGVGIRQPLSRRQSLARGTAVQYRVALEVSGSGTALAVADATSTLPAYLSIRAWQA